MAEEQVEHQDEKKPTQSKKFIAFVINELTWKVLIGIFLWIYSGQLFKTHLYHTLPNLKQSVSNC